MIEIPFIYADDCLDCNRMRTFLKMLTDGSDYVIKEINSDTDEAIDFAVENGIEDIPSCVIGDKVFFGKRGFTYETMKQAFENTKEK